VEPVVITATRVMEPVVITASRTGAFGFSETQLLVGSIIVIALLAWVVIPRIRRGHQPHA
jgi:hypothetical protein